MRYRQTYLITVLFLLFLVSESRAQFMGGLENFTVLDLKLAYSLPTGKYASVGGSDFESGYATSGLNISSGFRYMFNDYIGAGGSLNYCMHGYDKSARRQAIFLNDPSVTSAIVESTRYTNWTVTLGPALHKRFSEYLGLELKAEVGFMISTRPSQDFTISNANGTNSLTLDRISGTTFAYTLGGTLRYHATEVVALNLTVDFISGNPAYDYITYSAPNWIEIKGSQRISMVNLGLGVSYIVGY